MKKRILLTVAALVLASCGTQRQLQVVTHIQKDTLYLNRIQYDSVYVENFQSRDYHPSLQAGERLDTLCVEKSHIEYRYKLLRDTVRIVQIDSIPVIREVEVVKTERVIPHLYRASLWVCIGMLLAILSYITKKFFL